MLNENGIAFLNIFKPWLSVPNVLLGIAAVFVIALLDLTSSELASWVQAIGSIAAIWGAFMVSHHQMQRQQAEKLSELRSKQEAFYAVIENAVSHASSLGELADDKKPVAVVFVMFWNEMMSSLMTTAINGLEAIPMHELGSYERVLFHGSILSEMKKLNAKASAFAARTSFSENETQEFYAQISGCCKITAFYWGQFKSVSDAHPVKPDSYSHVD